MTGLRAYRLDVPPLLADRGIDRVLAFAVPLVMRFRGIEVREGTLLHGSEGWGEWSPFWDYDPAESASWLRAGIEGATQPVPAARRDRIPVNVTIPVVDADLARTMAAESACTTAKVKVADPRSDLWEDCRRVAAVREAMPDGQIRVDANAAWDVETAVRAITELDAAAEGLEYVEQPCASVAELAQVRRKVNVPVAADESVRRAEDPLAVARVGAADLIIVKAQPLAGVARALEVIDAAGLPAVVSSALDTSIGIGLATHLAAALPSLDYACGLGTIRLFRGDVSASPLLPAGGYLSPQRGEVDVEAEEPDANLCPRWSQRLDLTVAALADLERR
mgnify:FL=1